MLLSSGEFARMCNISRELLIHYDRIGLLKPKEVAKNGYRYYSLEQLYIYDIIRFFMDAGMSTKEIKDYLSKRTTQLFLDSIQERINSLRHQRDTLDARIGMMEKMRYLTQRALRFPKDRPRLIYWHELCLITTDIERIRTQRVYAKAMSEHSRFCRSLDGIALFPIGRIVDLPDPACPEDFYYTKLITWIDHPTKTDIPQNRIMYKPEGTYAVILHQGGIHKVGRSYEKLLTYIKDRGFDMLGPIYEMDVNSYLMSRSSDDYLLHISVLVDTHEAGKEP